MPHRWRVAAAAVLLQLSLGTVHAWSVFRAPLAAASGWSIPQITLAYTLAILLLGCTAPFGGLALERLGPRRAGLLAASLYGLGTLLAGLAANRLWLLYVGYGLLGGAGLGIGFVVPVAVVLRWFPDRLGLLSGIAVAGFGAGALLGAPLATLLVERLGVFGALAVLGPLELIVGTAAAAGLAAPPASHSTGQLDAARALRPAHRPLEALGTWQWCALWSVLLVNVAAGSALLSQAAAMVQEITGADASVAGSVVGALALANALGRLVWTALADRLGGRRVFVLLLCVQSVVLLRLAGMVVDKDALGPLVALAMLVVAGYGGGFGTLAALAADYFGTRHVGLIYGLLMTACGLGGVVGPLLLAIVRDSSGGYGPALAVLGLGALLGAGLAVALHPPVQAAAGAPASRAAPSGASRQRA